MSVGGYECGWYMHRRVCRCIYGGQRRASGVLLYHAPISLRQSVSLNLLPGWWPASLRDPPVSGVTEDHSHTQLFNMGAGDPNSVP